MPSPELRTAPVRRAVAVVHPRMGRGGSEAVAMWTLQALKDRFAVSIVTTNAVDLPALNSFYGTSVRAEDVTVRQVPVPRIPFVARGGAAIHGALFQRAMRRLAWDYDALLSVYNPTDFGRPAIHLLDLSWDERLRSRFSVAPRGMQGIFHQVAFVRAAYLSLARLLARPSGRDLFSGEDVLLAYSEWVASVIERQHGVRCGVLYPPVPDIPPKIPFAERKPDFVCVGRISEEKRLERVLGIVEKVRSRGHDVRLRLVGGLGRDAYARKIRALAAGLPWVALEGSVSNDRKAEILTSSRYGIHGAEGEAFGIAVAEMISAGCIAFAPAEGGPAEILGHDALLYRNDEEAVEKICAVLRSPALRVRLGEHLRRQAGKFSTDNFMRRIRAAVEEFLRASYPERDTAGA